MAADVVVDRALEAIARTRTRGMHLLGHFVGISGRPAPPGTARLTLDASYDQGIPVLAFAVFADLVVASAIRSRVAPGARLGTVTLSIQHRRVGTRGTVVGVGQAPPPLDGYGIAHGVFTVGEEVVGHAHASAAALPPPPGRTPRLLPWERDPLPAAPPVTPAELAPDEAGFLANVQEAERRATVAGTPVEDELVCFAWRATEPDRADGDLTIGPELSNRVGHLQGGALYAAAARAADRALGEGGWDLAEGTYQFLRPGDGRILSAQATVLRRGRSTAFVQVHLSVDGAAVGAGLFAFRAR
jgi:acyl-coenzyme A thioesterase PaaI-like protein